VAVRKSIRSLIKQASKVTSETIRIETIHARAYLGSNAKRHPCLDAVKKQTRCTKLRLASLKIGTLYRDLEKNDPKKFYRLARTRQRRSKDINQVVFIKNEQGKIRSEEKDIKERWKEYFKNYLILKREQRK